MALPWFKVAVGLSRHPKLMTLRVGSLDPLGVVIRLWEWVATYYPTGRVPHGMAEVMERAANAGADMTQPDDADAVTPGVTLRALHDARFLERIGDEILIHDWDLMQSAHKDHAEKNRERQRKYREKQRALEKRNVSITRDSNVTPNVSNVIGVTLHNAARGDREEDKNTLVLQPKEPRSTRVPRRNAAVAPEVAACRAVVAGTFERKHREATGGEFAWSAAARTAVAAIASSCDNDAGIAARVLEHAWADPWLRSHWRPSTVAQQASALRMKLGPPPPVATPAPSPEDLAKFAALAGAVRRGDA